MSIKCQLVAWKMLGISLASVGTGIGCIDLIWKEIFRGSVERWGFFELGFEILMLNFFLSLSVKKLNGAIKSSWRVFLEEFHLLLSLLIKLWPISCFIEKLLEINQDGETE